jgi:hypothetical protein
MWRASRAMTSAPAAGPIAVCAVNAVPTYRRSTTSLVQVENKPESAMTDALHTTSTASTRSG